MTQYSVLPQSNPKMRVLLEYYVVQVVSGLTKKYHNFYPILNIRRAQVLVFFVQKPDLS